MRHKDFVPMAIIGYGCVYPDNMNSSDKLWNMVVNGEAYIDEIPKERWDWRYYYSEDRNEEDKTYSKLCTCIQNFEFSEKYKERFSEEFERMNRIQMMALDTVLQCLDKTKYSLEDLPKQNIGFLMGNMLGDDLYPDFSLKYHAKEILSYIDSNGDFNELNSNVKGVIKKKMMELVDERFPSMDKNNTEKFINSTLPYLIKEILHLKGISCIVDGACSSGVLVIDEAIKLLNSRELDMCIATGALGSALVTGSVGFSKIGGLSAKRGRPLDKDASGLNSAEGFGTIIMKRLSDAVADGDQIHSVIVGIGSEDDGKGKSIYAPNRLGQCRAMNKALNRAKLNPAQIDYIELHATGTPTGDMEELETLKLLYKNSGLNKHTVPIGSIKSQIGHSFSAAGIASLIKVIESMKHKTYPVTWNYEHTPIEVNIEDLPIYVNTEAHEWKQREGVPRRAIVNAFGFGGINSSAVVEEYMEEYHKKLVSNKTEQYLDYSNIDVAIVGIGVIDGNITSKDNWLKKDKEPDIAEDKYPENRWSKRYSELYSGSFHKACFIADFKFPWLKFKIPPKVLDQIDRAQQLALIAADEAINEYGKEKMDKENVCVYVGKMVNSESASKFNVSVRQTEYTERLKKIDEFKKLSKEVQNSIINSVKGGVREYAPPMNENALPGYMDNIVSGRLSNFYNFTGTSVVVDAGSNSFLVALKQGIINLITGESDSVLVGGIHANMTPEFLHTFHAYEESRKNIQKKVPSEGAVFYVIKRSEDVKQGEKVYARIKAIVDEGIDNSKYVAKYTNSSQNLKTQDGDEMNYFGAQMGFEMLDAIKNMENGSYDKFMVDEQASDNVIKLTDSNYFSNTYTVYMTAPDDDTKVRRAETKDSEDKVKKDNMLR